MNKVKTFSKKRAAEVLNWSIERDKINRPLTVEEIPEMGSHLEEVFCAQAACIVSKDTLIRETVFSLLKGTPVSLHKFKGDTKAILEGLAYYADVAEDPNVFMVGEKLIEYVVKNVRASKDGFHVDDKELDPYLIKIHPYYLMTKALTNIKMSYFHTISSVLSDWAIGLESLREIGVYDQTLELTYQKMRNVRDLVDGALADALDSGNNLKIITDYLTELNKGARLIIPQ